MTTRFKAGDIIANTNSSYDGMVVWKVTKGFYHVFHHANVLKFQDTSKNWTSETYVKSIENAIFKARWFWVQS